MRALDSMSGGMECHCSCEEQLLAIGTGKVGVSTLATDAYETARRDGHRLVKKDCNDVCTRLRGNMEVENPPSQQTICLPRRPCPFACLFVRGYATLPGEPCSLDNTRRFAQTSSSCHRGWVDFLRHPVAGEPQQQRLSMS